MMLGCNSSNEDNIKTQNIENPIKEPDSISVHIKKTMDSSIVEFSINQCHPGFCSFEQYVIIDSHLSSCKEEIFGCNHEDTMAWFATYKIEYDTVNLTSVNAKMKLGYKKWHKDSIILQWNNRMQYLDSLNYDY
jgi:hypothetical protein